MAELQKDGMKRLFLSRKQFDEAGGVLRGFYQKTKCPVVVLADAAGMLVSHSGTMDNQNAGLLSALAAGNLAATGEIARLCGEEGGFQAQFLEGKKRGFYVSPVDGNFLVAVVFAENTTLGMVRVLLTKVMEQLREALRHKEGEEGGGETVEITMKAVESEGFQDELSSRLDSILFGKK